MAEKRLFNLNDEEWLIAVITVPKNNCVGLQEGAGLYFCLPSENGRYTTKNPNILALYDSIKKKFGLTCDHQAETFMSNGVQFYIPSNLKIKEETQMKNPTA